MQLPQWYYDLCEPEKALRTPPDLKAAQIKKYAKPLLFKSVNTSSTTSKRSRAQEDDLKQKKAWEMAIAPAKMLPLNLLMSYFSGNALQIMTISMTLYMFFLTPIQQILGTKNKFRIVEGKKIKSQIFRAKLVFILCNLLMVAAGVWKVGQMGLLPTHSTDWTAWERPARYIY